MRTKYNPALRHISEEKHPQHLIPFVEFDMQKAGSARHITAIQVRCGSVDNAMPNILGVLSSHDNEKCDAEYIASRLPYLAMESRRTSVQDIVPTWKLQSATDQKSFTVLTPSDCSTLVDEGRVLPQIPQRTTSIARPARRKRHRDLVAFHRNSCQLFSSLDGTLAQTWVSSSSSSSSSSTSSEKSSSLSSPMFKGSTRDSSLDSNFVNLSQTPTGQSTIVSTSDVKVPPKRPTLQRMPPTMPVAPPHPASSNDITSPSEKLARYVSEQPGSKSRPQIAVTQSYCSSQTSIPGVPAKPKHSPTLSTNTTIHWTSPETRHREYVKIDAANSGFRLFVRTLLPRSICRKVGGGRSSFCNDQMKHGEIDNDDDATSVRRFRVSVEDTDREALMCLRPDKKAPLVSIEQTEVIPEGGTITNNSQHHDSVGYNKEPTGLNCTSRTDTGLSSFSTLSSVKFESVPRNNKRRPGSKLKRLLMCRT